MDFTHLQIYNFHHFVEEENPSWCVWNEVILKRNPGNPTLITPFWKVKLWGKSGGGLVGWSLSEAEGGSWGQALHRFNLLENESITQNIH